MFLYHFKYFIYSVSRKEIVICHKFFCKELLRNIIFFKYDILKHHQSHDTIHIYDAQGRKKSAGDLFIAFGIINEN